MFSAVALSRLVPKDLAKLALRPITSTTVLQSDEYSRPKRAETSPKVRLGLIPDTWFTALYPKTGVTGPYVFGATLATYLLSKEIYILEHEYYSGVSIVIMIALAAKKLGPGISKSLDTKIDAIANEMDEGRTNTIKALQQSIANEEKALWQAEGQKLLLEAKRENIQLQLEAAYRERVNNAYKIVKKRLDYQVEKMDIERRIGQKNLVDWVVQNVLKNITAQQEKDTLTKCVSDLNSLAGRA